MSLQFVICLLYTLITVIYSKDTRIFGGVEARRNLYPYVASVKRISNDEHFCGGVIISARHVVTLAASVNGEYINSNDLEIRAGNTGTENDNEYYNGHNYKIEAIYVNPHYNTLFLGIYYFTDNIAVIRIRGSFDLGPSLNIIELPTADVFTRQAGTLVGWGTHTYPHDNSPLKLRKAWMIVTNKNECELQHGFRLRLDNFCAFQRTGVGACFGDSGNPFVINNKLAGLLIFYEPCATGKADVYINVFIHLNFINSIINPRINQ